MITLKLHDIEFPPPVLVSELPPFVFASGT